MERRNNALICNLIHPTFEGLRPLEGLGRWTNRQFKNTGYEKG